MPALFPDKTVPVLPSHLRNIKPKVLFWCPIWVMIHNLNLTECNCSILQFRIPNRIINGSPHFNVTLVLIQNSRGKKNVKQFWNNPHLPMFFSLNQTKTFTQFETLLENCEVWLCCFPVAYGNDLVTFHIIETNQNTNQFRYHSSINTIFIVSIQILNTGSSRGLSL